MVESYPLQWPQGWQRTERPVRAIFGDHSRNTAVYEVLHEIRLLGGKNPIISSNLTLRLDGLPRSGQRAPEDQGVAVYFDLHGGQQCFPCDRWTKIEHNLWAIAKSIAALRGLERWGAKDMVHAAFRGFRALPAPEDVIIREHHKPWHEVLEISPEASEDIRKAAYRAKVKRAHPDAGGTREAWEKIQKAGKEAGVI